MSRVLKEEDDFCQTRSEEQLCTGANGWRCKQAVYSGISTDRARLKPESERQEWWEPITTTRITRYRSLRLQSIYPKQTSETDIYKLKKDVIT